MKVAQINAVCGYGSTGSICMGISREARKQGIENVIFYGIGNTDYADAVRFGSQLNVKTHQVLTRVFGHHGFYSQAATIKLIKMLEAYDPDLVHLHNIHGHYINVKILFHYLKQKQIPVIWTFHDCWPITGHCTHFDYVHCERWKTGCYGCFQLREYPVTYFHDPSPKNWKLKKDIFTSLDNLTVVSVSDWLVEVTKKSFFSAFPILRIYNGVDLSIFCIKNANDLRMRFQVEEKFVILGMAGKWLDERNNPVFHTIMENMEEDMVVILLGIYGKEAKIKTYGNRIISLPTVTSRELMADYYNMADVFVNLSYEDTFGLVNAEALACGTPVIVFDSTACAEVPGKYGECGEVQRVAEKKNIFEKITEVKRKGKASYQAACRRRAEQLFSDQQCYQEYITLYQNVLKRYGEK